GDWRDSDVESVRQIVVSFKSCLHWFENNYHTNLITLFAKKDLSTKDFPALYRAVFDVQIKDCEPAREFNEKQSQYLDAFLKKIMGVSQGICGTFGDLNNALKALLTNEMSNFQTLVENLHSSQVFDSNGKLKEDRTLIFNEFEKIT